MILCKNKGAGFTTFVCVFACELGQPESWVWVHLNAILTRIKRIPISVLLLPDLEMHVNPQPNRRR